MTEPTDEEFCARVAETLGLPSERCKPDTPLKDLAVDSLGQIELSIDVQDEYEVMFGFEELSQIETLSDLARLIRQQKAAELTRF